MSRQTSDASASSVSIRASETQTKRQRQNAARRESEKDAKASADREREALLAKHRRERISELYKAGDGRSARATVDENNKLSWVS